MNFEEEKSSGLINDLALMFHLSVAALCWQKLATKRSEPRVADKLGRIFWELKEHSWLLKVLLKLGMEPALLLM